MKMFLLSLELVTRALAIDGQMIAAQRQNQIPLICDVNYALPLHTLGSECIKSRSFGSSSAFSPRIVTMVNDESDTTSLPLDILIALMDYIHPLDLIAFRKV